MLLRNGYGKDNVNLILEGNCLTDSVSTVCTRLMLLSLSAASARENLIIIVPCQDNN